MTGVVDVPRAGARTRRSLGMAAFWVSSLSVGLAAFIVLAVLAHTGETGELAAASAVISTSFVLAVVPGAIQLRAAADRAAGLSAGAPWPLIGWSTALLLAAAAPVAAGLAVPAVALGLLALQYAVAALVSAQRGAAIGAEDHAAASWSMATEAGVRVIAGVLLGTAFGASGLAAGLLLGSVAAALVGRHVTGRVVATSARGILAPAVGVGLLMLLVNADAFAAPRILGGAAADAYAVAELPARGVFFALFAVSWLAVPLAVRAASARELLLPVGGVAALGAAAGLTLLAVRPLLSIALGDPAPSAGLLATLVAAMTLAAVLATILAMAIARAAWHPWAPTLVAVGVLASAIAWTTPGAPALATLVLAAVTAALALTLALLLRTLAPRGSSTASSPPLATR